MNSVDLSYYSETMDIMKFGYRSGFSDGFNCALLAFFLVFIVFFVVVVLFLIFRKGKKNG